MSNSIHFDFNLLAHHDDAKIVSGVVPSSFAVEVKEGEVWVELFNKKGKSKLEHLQRLPGRSTFYFRAHSARVFGERARVSVTLYY